ncbi:MAG: hypothetical protein H0W83_00510 [Planctomycetes bacterium]|nr:hypothetical protein [Planctomycetota bacterium]
MRHSLTTTILLLALCQAPAASADHVEVVLKNGDRIYGELNKDESDSITVARRLWAKGGCSTQLITYPRPRITSITVVASLADLYKARAVAAADTFEDQWVLVHWCLDRGLDEEALAHARRVYAFDPKDNFARKLLEDDLGCVLDGGVWIRRTDYANRHGLVLYGGKLMTPAEIELRKAHSASVAALAVAEDKVKDLDAQLALSLQRLKTATLTHRHLLRRDAEAKTAAELKRRETMTKAQIEDEDDERRFDAEHHIARPDEQAPKDSLDAKKSFDDAELAHQKLTADREAARIAHEKAIAQESAARDAIEKAPTRGK